MVFMKKESFASRFLTSRNLKTNKNRSMKRKGFKKETSLARMKGDKQIIDMYHLTHGDVILDDDERSG